MLKKSSNSNRLYYFKHEIIGKSFVTFFGFFLIILTLCLVLFIATKGLALFFNNNTSILEFLFSTVWKPDRTAEDGGARVGALIFIFSSIVISGIALLISTPFSIGTAIFMNEISPKLGRKLLQPVIEIFVGIPSVVYGWVGLSILVPFIRNKIGGLGFSVLAGSIVLAIMIFPTIASVASDALKVLPGDYKEASYALGATRWQTIRKVLLPSAMPGIMTGVVLGLARAFGEALAVQMVIGNSIRFPKSLLDSTSNLTSILTMDMANTVDGSQWNNALWSMALLLLVLSFVFIAIIHRIGARGGQKQ